MNTMQNESTTSALRSMQNTKSMLTSPEAVERLSMVAASHMNPQRMLRVVAVAAMKTPKLYDVHPLSMLGALMSAASLGLEPNSPLGHCFLIPFENRRAGRMDVELVLGYKGMIQLALNSGLVSSIRANIHYDDDEAWEWDEGAEASLRHRPGAQEGAKLHAYAAAKGPNGFSAWMVYPWSRVLKIRDGSANWKSAVQYNKTASSPWKTAEDAMARKTMIRALFNMLPKSSEILTTGMDVDGNRGAEFGRLALNPDMAQSGEYIMPNGADIDHDDEPEAERPKEEATPRRRAAAKRDAATEKPADPAPKPEPVAEVEVKTAQEAETDPAQDAGAEAAVDADDPATVDASGHPVYQEVEMILAEGVNPATIRMGMEQQFAMLAMAEPEVMTAINKLLDSAAQAEES